MSLRIYARREQRITYRILKAPFRPALLASSPAQRIACSNAPRLSIGEVVKATRFGQPG